MRRCGDREPSLDVGGIPNLRMLVTITLRWLLESITSRNCGGLPGSLAARRRAGSFICAQGFNGDLYGSRTTFCSAGIRI